MATPLHLASGELVRPVAFAFGEPYHFKQAIHLGLDGLE